MSGGRPEFSTRREVALLIKPLLVTALFLLLSPLLAQHLPVCDVRSFGAKGDGFTLDTRAVSEAVAACEKRDGGTVYFAPGRYVIGTVQLYSHIRLQLESGAALVGSHDLNDYLPSPPYGFARDYGINLTGEGYLLGMLIAKNADDISIEGHGEIDGQGDNFMALKTPHKGNDYASEYVRDPQKFDSAMSSLEFGPVEPNQRPGTMIVFYHCTNVQLHGVTLRSAPNWTLHLQDVDGAVISGIQILNDPLIPNNDGIDCMQCRHVRISDCDIRTGDDGFAIVGSEHVDVSNCSVASRSAAIRLESTRLSTFTGLSMDTNRGIAIFANGYANQPDRPTEDVTFSNIVMRTRLIPGHWWGKGEPIYIAVQSCVTGSPCGVRVRNVVFDNITAEAENGALLWGGTGTPITGVVLNGVRLHMLTPSLAMSSSVGGNLDLRWTASTPREGIVKSDIPAVYAKQVASLTLRDVQVDWAPALPGYYSDGVRVEDFTNLSVDGYGGRQAHDAFGAALSLHNGSGLSVTNSHAAPGTRTFLEMENVSNRRVFVNYDLRGASQVILPASQRFDTEVGLPAVKNKTGKRTHTSAATSHP